MNARLISIPTYDPDGAREYDYDRACTLTLEEVDGLKVSMGGPTEKHAPNVTIEKGTDLWRVFVCPDDAGELCIIEIRKTHAQVMDERGRILIECALEGNERAY